MSDYLETNKEEFNAIYFLDRLLRSKFAELYPDENERLAKLNVYGDNRKDHNNLEGLMFCCMDKAIERGDIRALSCFMQLYNIANNAEKEGNSSYSELIDAISNVVPSNTKPFKETKIRRKLPDKTTSYYQC